jgi:peptide deformylase
MDIITNIEILHIPTEDFDLEGKDRLSNVFYIHYNLEKEMFLQSGQGLAANQLGFNKSMFIMKVEHGTTLCIINPVIIKSKGKIKVHEGCLSLPGKTFEVVRPEKIIVTGFNQYMKPVKHKFEGIEARRACHEIDHLKGIILSDIGKEVAEVIR